MEMEKKVLELNLDDILPNRFQPRIKFEEQAINELSESIKEHGVIQPIIVRKIGDKYEIIAGERRYKASVIAGKNTIPAIITDLDDKESAEVALIENVQRQDLTPIEEAVSYRKILDMGYLTQEELANKLDRNQSTIANKLRLLNLDDDVQEALLNKKISERHARSLLKISNGNQQREMLKKIIEDRLTVRKTDEAIDNMLKGTDVEETNNEIFVDDQKEDKMNNNMNNDIFNIPSEPIIDDVEMETISQDINTIAEDNKTQISNNYVNPGFMDIDNIEKNAEDIYVEKPAANINDLLETKKDNNVNYQPIVETVENHNPDEFIIHPSKFFNMDDDIVEEKPIQEDKIDVFTTDSFVNNEFDNSFNQSSANNFINNDEKKEDKSIIDSFDYNFDSQLTNVVDEPKQEVIPELEEIKIDDFIDEIKFDDDSDNSQTNLYDPLEDSIPELDLEKPAQSSTYMAGDLKTVINTIRNCAETIEKYGYIIDTEELDFEDTYQVIFKIEKKN
jgi:ParB family chromosome partitioning protein